MKVYLVREYDYDWSETHGAYSSLELAQVAADKAKPPKSYNHWTIEEVELDTPTKAVTILEFGRSQKWQAP